MEGQRPLLYDGCSGWDGSAPSSSCSYLDDGDDVGPGLGHVDQVTAPHTQTVVKVTASTRPPLGHYKRVQSSYPTIHEPVTHRPGLCENSTAYTVPSGPRMSDTCETVVPEAAPRYSTLEPGGIQMLSTPEQDGGGGGGVSGRGHVQAVVSVPDTECVRADIRLIDVLLRPGQRLHCPLARSGWAGGAQLPSTG